MKYYSTKNDKLRVSARQAVIQGLPEDNGLFMPEFIPVLPPGWFNELPKKSLTEIAFDVLYPYFQEDIDEVSFEDIISSTFSFSIPLVPVTENVFSLELYHGPTMAFKDVGAGFLSGCLDHFSRGEAKKVTVLVATSGDTGSAVANGFYGAENVNVVILYPKGKISEIQRLQMTTLGKNITALEIDGTFDDCQRLVKTAFLDQDLSKQLNLTSANSINIARFLAQSVYYFHALGQVSSKEEVVVSVPSGNFGNLTAGLIAQRMGLPISHFIASTNINDIVPEYLLTGKFAPRESRQTISNAMDVGNPSNFVRILDIFDGDFAKVRQAISGHHFTDEQTVDCISRVYKESGYILDPHGAVGYLGLESTDHSNGMGIFLETAHPYKFGDHVVKVTGSIPMPSQVEQINERESVSIPLSSDYNTFKDYLLV